jgi:hypothetical protein
MQGQPKMGERITTPHSKEKLVRKCYTGLRNLDIDGRKI